MNDSKNTPPHSSLILRIFGGGYLIYLAWDMLGAVPEGPLYLIPIVIFALAGAVLAGHSIWVLTHHDYFRKDTESNSEEMEDETNE